MEIGIFGASGVIGGRVLEEAVSLGHRVRAFTRAESRIPAETGAVTWRVANVVDPDEVAAAIAGLDVVVNAINTGNDVPETIANAGTLPAAARTLLTALEQHPATRVIVVGGAGSLEVRPGLQLVDVEGFAERLPDSLGVPEEYVKVVLAHREALNLYRLSNRNWTYVSPSAGLVQPGERTGRFRMGGNQLLVRADGTTGISAEDLAVAILDEIEFPRHIQRRFTVGY
ncbi:NAD(P)H-binding protein [Amycolatopsis cynarae]|uniref:NAD(P)H-binding protein n=1 Tax=Amycolatopsis cynarae TaxID=2995223 RepID=A0ABY7B2F8_9PSEU|nr:NAD(P)H-binding protein [Amycolatopsis sp. HUAS 11-8]WAL65071.1 NAD(P)H-binding protein [Amycolatopsis sp. HUAS 11-8]